MRRKNLELTSDFVDRSEQEPAQDDWLDAVSIELMQPQDLSEVLAIERKSFPSTWSLESYLRELDNDSSYYIVARLQGSIIGYAGMWVIADEAHISTLAVHPKWRRGGLGGILLSHLIANARREGATEVTLEVREANLVAQALYHKFGFQSLHILPHYYGDTGENALMMHKPLTKELAEDEDELESEQEEIC